MDDEKKILIGAVVVLCALLFVCFMRRRADWQLFIEGMWIAGDEFCVRSDLDSMMIYIGPNTGTMSEQRKAFMVMYINKTVVSRGLCLRICRGPLSTVIDIDPDEGFTDTLLPERVKVEYCIPSGSMTWSSEDTVYAELYKDAVSTASV